MITIEGDKELAAALKKYGDVAEDAISDAVRITALSVEADVIKSLQRGSRSGATYVKNNPKRVHKASAPGEAPKSDTGYLAGSIKSIIKPSFAFVGTVLDYAFQLEYGTQKLKERPFFRPAREKNKKLFVNRVKAAMKKAGESI